MTWEEVKKQYKGVDRAVLVIKEYMKLDSYQKIADKYGTDRGRITASVNTQKEELEEKYPELYAAYRKKSISNKGKTGKRLSTKERAEWAEVKKKYQGVERAKFVIEESIRLGGLKALEVKYSLAANNFSKMICEYKKELEEKYPKEFRLYQNTGSAKKGRKIKSLGKKFRLEVLDLLDKEVSEYDFRDFLINYNVGERSTLQLIQMAKEKGVRVYELTNDGKKKFIV